MVFFAKDNACVFTYFLLSLDILINNFIKVAVYYVAIVGKRISSFFKIA